MRTAAIARGVCRGVMALWLAAVVPLAAHAAISEAYLQRFDAAKHLIALSDGETLAYLDIGPRNAVPVVLLHGYTDSARDWAPIAPFLSGRFRLIIPDLRGQGASSKPDCCYTRFDFANDIKLLLERLQVPRAVVVGHSLGSIVAQTFAEEWPASTRRLILISSTGTYFGPASGQDCPCGRIRAARIARGRGAAQRPDRSGLGLHEELVARIDAHQPAFLLRP